MKTLKAVLLAFVVVSQVFYVKYVIVPDVRRHAHKEPPPNYRVLTDGKEWVWEHNLSPEFPDKWFREILTHSSKGDAIASAWAQYEYELHESTNKWVTK